MSITSRSFLLAGILFLITANVIAQKSWEGVTLVEDVCAAYPEAMKSMLDQFNLDYPGLEKVKAANNSGNLVDACQYLLAYCQCSHTAQDLRKELPQKQI